MNASPVEKKPGTGKNVPLWRMFVISVAALFLELFLIRWAGTEVRVFAYVQNLVLVACFLGFGVGCFAKNVLRLFVPPLGKMHLGLGEQIFSGLCGRRDGGHYQNESTSRPSQTDGRASCASGVREFTSAHWRDTGRLSASSASSIRGAARKKKPRVLVRPAVLLIKPLGVGDGGVALRRTRIG